MDYEKELSRIRKLLEKVNCSDDEKNDKDGFSSDSSGKEDCLEEDAVQEIEEDEGNSPRKLLHPGCLYPLRRC